MSDSERIDELNNHINILLAQSHNIDNPYTESEYRALVHQIDRLTIKRDLLQDRVNVSSYKQSKQIKHNKKDLIINNITLLIIILIYVTIIMMIITR